ncbi:MAG: diguanylate cyclase [Nitrospirae bacterium]|nr:diguanylate cyclase [Nitrospirota bacterium]
MTDKPAPYIDSSDYLQAIVNHNEHPTLIIDTQYRVIMTNHKLLGIARKINTGSPSMHCYEITHNLSKPCSGKSNPCPLQKVLQTKLPVVMTHTHFDSLYNKMFVEITATPILDGNGEVLHIIETFKNVTRQSKIETALRESEVRYRSLFEQSGDAIFILKAEGPQMGKILSANKAACQMYGYSEEEFLRLSITDLDTPEHAAKAPKRIRRILEGETLRLEITHTGKDGKVFPVEVSASLMQIDGRKFVLSIYRDISKRKEIEGDRDVLIRELQHLSQTDGLTGLFNRQHLDKRLTEEMERARRYGSPLSLIIFDIDHFKRINDSYGHIIGDKMLQTTASVIRDTLRTTDIAGRFGGDEFVVILVQTDIGIGVQVAERLRSRIGQELVPVREGQTAGFSISLGICQFDGAFKRAEDFIAKADTALYEAKRNRRNTVCKI